MHHKQIWTTQFLGHAALMAMATLFLTGCPEQQIASDVGDRKPRREEPLRKELPPEKKPLIGLFVDAASKTPKPDGKSWATAFPTIMAAVDVSTGENIYVAAGTYKSPRINLHDKENIRLYGGYKAGDRYEKEDFVIEPDAWAILDGEGANRPLVRITGNSQKISFLGGFAFKNVIGESAFIAEGANAVNRVKDIMIVAARFEDNDNNLVGADGGGFRIKFAENLTLEGIDAVNNRAARHGGFMYLNTVRELSIKRGVWDNNVAGGSGGALHSTDAERMTLMGQSVRNNRAQSGAGFSVVNHHNQSITDVNFADNTAQVNGAGIAITDTDNLTLSRLKFSGHSCTGPGDGAALFAYRGSGLALNLGDGEIKGGRSQDGGAFMFQAVNGITIDGGKFLDNKATRDGGTIMVVDTQNFIMRNSVIEDTEAVRLGGAVMLFQPGLQVLVQNVSVKNARATGRGGALQINGAFVGKLPTVTIEDSKFEDNHSVGNGGAISTSGISYKVEINRTLFKNNRTDNFGGALALDGKTSALSRFVIGEGTKFIDNRATLDYGGGAILAVFNHAIAVGPPSANATDRQLVFFNTKADLQGNRAGGLNGNILRVTSDNVDQIPPAVGLSNAGPPPRDYMAQYGLGAAPPFTEKRLNYFIAYSMVAHHTAPWDRLLLDWEGSTTEVYTW